MALFGCFFLRSDAASDNDTVTPLPMTQPYYNYQQIATATEAIAEVVVANINAASFDDLKTYVRGNINPGLISPHTHESCLRSYRSRLSLTIFFATPTMYFATNCARYPPPQAQH
jgi:hypothetical protein